MAGTGLMFTVGAFALAACGADPSDAAVDPAPEASTSVVQKQAGLHVIDVRLTVINDSGQTRPVKICNSAQDAAYVPTNCPFFAGDLLHGHEALGQNPGTGVYGYINDADGSVTYFQAKNPAFGEPFINLSTLPGGRGEGPGDVTLSAGEIKKGVLVRDHVYQLERRGDTSYKEMRLIIE